MITIKYSSWRAYRLAAHKNPGIETHALIESAGL
jgi:hypothetical protein